MCKEEYETRVLNASPLNEQSLGVAHTRVAIERQGCVNVTRALVITHRRQNGARAREIAHWFVLHFRYAALFHLRVDTVECAHDLDDSRVRTFDAHRCSVAPCLLLFYRKTLKTHIKTTLKTRPLLTRIFKDSIL